MFPCFSFCNLTREPRCRNGSTANCPTNNTELLELEMQKKINDLNCSITGKKCKRVDIDVICRYKSITAFFYFHSLFFSPTLALSLSPSLSLSFFISLPLSYLSLLTWVCLCASLSFFFNPSTSFVLSFPLSRTVSL